MTNQLSQVGKGAMKGATTVGKAGLGFFSDFKAFISRGNVVDLAVGLVIGAAFTAIVKSLVEDIFTPVISLALGSLTFAEQFVVMRQGAKKDFKYKTRAEAKADGAITLDWGSFVQAIIAFLIVAWALFIFIKVYQQIVREKKKEETRKCDFCKEAVHKEATRCKFCTSVLPDPNVSEATLMPDEMGPATGSSSAVAKPGFR
ncbi:large-conductance mechanosensitive channel [Catenaria anguillulae PL171]|uniref:Large-conductance mechanosensitive channel n=1 Tax=Catenaria anguillulae PL171 TaxID=765915 RepID=A0A1Y2HCL8_9FUNG|nr:large-conductance mechanosensitive channel [Catenaria anguillulae PL171]